MMTKEKFSTLLLLLCNNNVIFHIKDVFFLDGCEQFEFFRQFFFLFSSLPSSEDRFLLILEREGRERKHRSAASHTRPHLGWNLQSGYVP